MIIHGLNKTTLLDYPGHLACSIFCGNCNMRCIYCQNSSLVLSPDSEPIISEDELFSFLNNRKNILQGICISGGEPTLSKDLPDFISRINDLGYKVKLDTNGTNPEMIEYLIKNKLVQMIAMDIKGSLDDYCQIAGISPSHSNAIIEGVKKTAALLIESGIEYEFRTTLSHNMLSKDSFVQIGKWLQNAKAYYLQAYVESPLVMTKGLIPPTYDELELYRQILIPYIPNTFIRGIDAP